MKEYEQRATKIIMNTVEGVKAQIRKAYNKGYKDGKADTPFTDTEEAEKKAYNRGLVDMFEAFKSMRMMTADDLEEVFGLRFIGDILVNLSPSKIISKYHAFKSQIKELETSEIKVGDEVRLIGSNPQTDDCDYGICTKTKSETIYVMRKDGSVGEENKAEWIKTSRTFPQIAEVLAELRGAENDEQ